MKVVTFGEIMLRLSAEGYHRFVQADRYDAAYGGEGADTAVCLANFRMDSKFVSRVPGHEIGQAGIDSLRKFGVDTSDIVRGGKRMGIYYLERGTGQRLSKVIYDRTGSSFAEASREDFDWDKILERADWFHFAGATPALSDNVAEVCLEAVKRAKEKGITISCNLAYRKESWSREKAGRVMGELCRYVDVCIVGEQDAQDIFDIKGREPDGAGIRGEGKACMDVARQLVERFGFRKVAMPLCAAGEGADAAMFYDGEGYHFSKSHVTHDKDWVGGGDSFSAGLIYGCLRGMESRQILSFAVAADRLRQSIQGGLNMVCADEVLELAARDDPAQVRR